MITYELKYVLTELKIELRLESNQGVILYFEIFKL